MWIRLLRWKLVRRPGRLRRVRQVRFDGPDALEPRQLLAAKVYTFTPPDLTGLPSQPSSGPAIYNRMLGSLQAQLNDSPLSDLTDGKINENEYVTAVASLAAGFEAAGESALRKHPAYARLIPLQANALNAATAVVGQIYDAKLVDASGHLVVSNPAAANLTIVDHLTLSRPLWTFRTPLLNIIDRIETFQSELTTVAANVPNTVTIADADRIAHVEAQSFLADMALTNIGQPNLARFMGQQVQTLVTALDAAAQSGNAGLGAFHDAIGVFTEATYDRQTGAGYLGPRGVYGHGMVQPTNGAQTANLIPNHTDANTFAFGRYTPATPARVDVYHRNYGGPVSRFGRFVTTTLYPNSQQAIRRSALDQTFPQANNAFYVTDVVVPAGLLRYVGRVAPIFQGVLTPRNTLYPGLGPQILLSDSRAPGVDFVNQRTTGT